MSDEGQRETRGEKAQAAALPHEASGRAPIDGDQRRSQSSS
jgi:hypothetical protein